MLMSISNGFAGRGFWRSTGGSSGSADSSSSIVSSSETKTPGTPPIAFPLRNRDDREATLREVLLHRRSLVLDDEDRKVPRSRERLVLRSDGLEPFDVVRNAANKDFQGLVSSVVLEGEGQLREGGNRIDLLLQLHDQSLRLLLGGVFFRNVEFEREDLLADVADDWFHALRLALFDLEHRSD